MELLLLGFILGFLNCILFILLGMLFRPTYMTHLLQEMLDLIRGRI